MACLLPLFGASKCIYSQRIRFTHNSNDCIISRKDGILNKKYPKDRFVRNVLTDWKEQEKIRSEINTNYRKYRSNKYCVHISYDLSGESFAYFFINYGFDDYIFYAKILID